ncbi:hypothetical protein D9758_013061 [Tetrapyrgos nigripes]|uniref:RNA ligase domain-containing protein n=1 Tax=Tetrapyrgos nigripes TaxID=182062 RepID=A0A8H5FQA9_9AGAR|nr:hypothetical protein D9758_013061 [Tetrapyrgos nigripes]
MSTTGDQFVRYPQTPSFVGMLDSITTLTEYEATVPDLSSLLAPKGGTFLGSVKLHGTNLTIVFRRTADPGYPIVQIQSRNRILSVKSDNGGAFVFLNGKPLHLLVEKILGLQGGDPSYKEIFIAGEWAGQRIQSGVALTKLPVFLAIFNICIDGKWVEDMRKYRNVGLPEHRIFNVFDIGPTWEIRIRDFKEKEEVDRVVKITNELTNEVGKECPFAVNVSKYLLPQGPVARGTGEGIVWTMVDAPEGNLWNFKTKIDTFSTVKSSATKAPKDAGIVQKAQAFVDYACPLDGRRLMQGLEYLKEVTGIQRVDLKYTGQFIKWVVNDTMTEEGRELERFEADPKEVKKLLATRAGSWLREQTGRTIE